MATPVQRTSHVPASPAAHPTTDHTPVEPLPVAGPVGWVLALSGAVGLLLATWLVYPLDYDGMWAGYRGSLIGTVVIVAVMWLRSSFPAMPAVGLIGICGALLVLFGVFLDNPTAVTVSELSAGVVLLLAAGLLASGGSRR